MGCVPPLRATSKIQLPKLRSVSQSLVRLMGSARNSLSKSSKMHSTSDRSDRSDRSEYEDLELGGSRKQPRLESALIYGNSKGFCVSEKHNQRDGSLANLRDDRDIQRTDAFKVSYDKPEEPQENF